MIKLLKESLYYSADGLLACDIACSSVLKVFSEVLKFLLSLSVYVLLHKMLTHKAEQILCSVFT